MTVWEAVQERQSVRHFRPDPVSEQSLRAILEAGRQAASSLNKQRRRFIVVMNEATRARLAEASDNQGFVARAPVVIVICSDEKVDETLSSNGVHKWVVDTTIAATQMMLAAVGEGLGSCWVGSFDEGVVREILGIPGNIRVCCLLPVGVPARRLKRKFKKPMESVVFREGWGGR